MIKRGLHIILILCVFVIANAQDDYRSKKLEKQVFTEDLLEKTKTIKGKLYQHSFEEGFQKKYATNEFDYSKTKARVSLWSRLIDWLTDFIKNLLPDNMPIRDINRFTELVLYLFYVILLVGVMYVLVRVIGTKQGNWFFTKKNTVVNPEVNPLEENIHEIDFPAMIVQYEQQGDYRMAVRYQFLYVLKILSDNGKIDWHIEKTNSDYLKEFTKPEDRQQFEGIVYIFDYVWYGEFPIDRLKYESLIPKFQAIKVLKDE